MTAASRSQSGVLRATGRDRDEWNAILDDWGAKGRPFREIADWLKTEHGLSHWWAQKLIVEYEQARGIRPPGVRRDGTFTVTATKTVNVPVKRLAEAFLDASLRRRWLPGTKLRKRTTEGNRSARFDWEQDGSRLNVAFFQQGKGKSQVAVTHERLRDAMIAAEMKSSWRERLAALKDLLES